MDFMRHRVGSTFDHQIPISLSEYNLKFVSKKKEKIYLNPHVHFVKNEHNRIKLTLSCREHVNRTQASLIQSLMSP